MKNKRKTRIIPVPIIKKQVQKEEISLPKEVGKFLLDISKLVTGGAVITTALQLNSDKYLVIVIALKYSNNFLCLWISNINL